VGGDAWAIWNLRARFLFRAGNPVARRLFREPGLVASRLSVTAAVFIARSWKLAGAESPLTADRSGLLLSASDCPASWRRPWRFCVASIKVCWRESRLPRPQFSTCKGRCSAPTSPSRSTGWPTLSAMALADRFGSPGLRHGGRAAAGARWLDEKRGASVVRFFPGNRSHDSGAFAAACCLSGRRRARARPSSYFSRCASPPRATSSAPRARSGMMDRFLEPRRVMA